MYGRGGREELGWGLAAAAAVCPGRAAVLCARWWEASTGSEGWGGPAPVVPLTGA